MAFIEKLEASWQNPLQSRTTAGVIIKDIKVIGVLRTFTHTNRVNCRPRFTVVTGFCSDDDSCGDEIDRRYR